MGKNKGKAHAGATPAASANRPTPNSTDQSNKSEPKAPPAADQGAPKAADVEKATEQVQNLNLENGEEANRDDVMAARKAKAAAKAEKAAKAAAKKAADAASKVGDEASTAADAKPDNHPKAVAPKQAAAESEMSREEVIAARKAKAVQQRAEKASKSDKPKQEQKQQQGQKEEPKSKSNLKQAPSSPSENVKEVRFGVTRSESEENLMKAMIHAENTNVKIEVPLRDMRVLIHSAFYPLVDRCESGECEGADELCLLFMECVAQFIRNFSEEYGKMWPDAADNLGNMMDESLKAQLGHLTQGDRYPLPYALGNIIRQLRKQMMHVGVTDEKGRIYSVADLLEWLEDSENQYFSLANKAISGHLQAKIAEATKIITYDWCPVVNHILLDAKSQGKLRKLTVLDAVKNGPGMRHLTSLTDHFGYVEYGDLTAIGSIFERGSLVLLGCSAVLSSGKVCLSRGAFQLALVARAANVPVLILAPTYKFVDKAQASTRFALLGRTPLDILPPDLITAIVTDIRLLPPSSAPAVLKAKALDDAN
ncbi:hypothetical protein PFISCL1PPCAC_2679 [Pristionchus fissidentatus]|uniref:Translation initiation factor eIF2B subunit delta n=1 Tax=Pristionchus fissidentatus TaxID=1538716 RepID=A0AAV5UZ61_9BILA|nr:hypothetical protein PFISCL1PPCAC_2679 [Pristionchus fissidentatus]